MQRWIYFRIRPTTAIYNTKYELQHVIDLVSLINKLFYFVIRSRKINIKVCVTRFMLSKKMKFNSQDRSGLPSDDYPAVAQALHDDENLVKSFINCNSNKRIVNYTSLLVSINPPLLCNFSMKIQDKNVLVYTQEY